MNISNLKYSFLLTLLSSMFLSDACHAISQTVAVLPEWMSDLGWVVAPKSATYCEGYFAEAIAKDPASFLSPGKIAVSFDQQSTFSRQGTSVLNGHVEIKQERQRLETNQAILIRDPKTKKINLLRAKDKIKITEPEKVVVGKNATYQLDTQETTLHQVAYRTTLSNKVGQQPSLSAWGRADFLHQLNSTVSKLYRATFSTCSPLDVSWHVAAKEISLNKQTGRGTAYHSIFYAKDIPLFYSPYFSFPIDARRESGFLYPSVGYSSVGGMLLTAPYYINLAPNYDDTLTPMLYSRRGVLLNNYFRYLTPYNKGWINADIIFNDRGFREFKVQYPNNPALYSVNTTRTHLSLQDTSQWDSHWSSTLNYNVVSDDYFLQDFNSELTLSQRSQLLRQAQLNYQDEHIQFSGLLERYQTLHPFNQSSYPNQYARLPALNLLLNYPATYFGLASTLSLEWVKFSHAPGIDPTTFNSAIPSTFSQRRNYAEGERSTVIPTLSRTFGSLAGYLTPSVQVAASHYALHSAPTWPQSQINRVVPIVQLDSGLYLQQSLNNAYRQTFEPRLAYLYVPYREQSAIPEFDTLVLPFTYDQMFRTNRFTGMDRIGDANQVVFGATSRLLNRFSGNELARLSVGETYYFRSRRVTACNYPGCVLVENPGFNKPFSPIASTLMVNLAQALSLTGNYAFDPNTRSTNNSAATLAYKPDGQRSLLLNYSYSRNINDTYGYDMIPVANQSAQHYAMGFSWPLQSRWTLLGSLNYAFFERNNATTGHATAYYTGAQYDSCCFALRGVVGRVWNGVQLSNGSLQYDHRIYLQILLKGLGALGNTAADNWLAQAVPGFSNEFR